MKSADESAFPTIEANWANENVRGPGLTKREYFAAMAMQGVLSAMDDQRKGSLYHPEDVSSISVSYADALIAELAKVETV